MSGSFLDRWSRRKLASAGKALLADAPAHAVPPVFLAEPGGQGDLSPAPIPGAEVPVQSAVETQLPAVEELTLASDFTAFLKEEVSETLRRQALHKLFADPHFNRMDGLDIYIDDYSLPDPIPPEAMAKLKHAREWLMASEAEVEAAAAVKDDTRAGQQDEAGAAAEAVVVEGETAKADDGAMMDVGPATTHAAIDSGQNAP